MVFELRHQLRFTARVTKQPGMITASIGLSAYSRCCVSPGQNILDAESITPSLCQTLITIQTLNPKPIQTLNPNPIQTPNPKLPKPYPTRTERGRGMAVFGNFRTGPGACFRVYGVFILYLQYSIV